MLTFAGVLLTFCTACADRDPAGPSLHLPVGARVQTTIVCTVDVDARNTTCVSGDGRSDAARRNVYSTPIVVDLETRNQTYSATDSIYSAEMRIVNRLDEPLGTTDGSNVTGIRAFFAGGPVVTAYRTAGDATPPSGVISRSSPGTLGIVRVENADGSADFTAPDQPYFQYDEVVGSDGRSQYKTWRWIVPANVLRFSYTIKLVGIVPSEGMPAIPPNPDALPDSVQYLVRSPIDSTRIWRRAFSVEFADTVSGATVANLIAKYGAIVLDGNVRNEIEYELRFPDPGPTYNQWLAFMHRLDAEPGVRLVIPRFADPPRPVQFSRYPDDAPGFRRADWASTATSPSTWAWRAIRAPEAWGCETGVYDTTALPKVGVLDFEFDPLHPDLLRSNPAYVHPYPITSTIQDTAFDRTRWHGTAVAGVVSAQGDNRLFTAGVMWRTRLFLYGIGSPTGPTAPSGIVPRTAMMEVMTSAAKQGVRIMSVSIDWTLPRDSTGLRAQASFEQALRRFVIRANALIVYAAGNSGTTIVPAQSPPSFQSAILNLRSRYPDRVVIVGGTSPGNQWWTHSSWHPGVTDIAAPADNVALLGMADPGSAFFGQVLQGSGTSFAQPLVAGVAAQLWTLDPSLSAAQVKSYLVRGAREPRPNPLTGVLETPLPVQGAPGTIYQLDAYSSLSLLSKERDGTPICGFPVTQGSGAIYLQRRAGATTTLSAPRIGYTDVSVAQGGRMIAYGVTGDTVRVIDQRGTLLNTVPGAVKRIFLERDTVDLTRLESGNTHATLVTLRGHDGTVQGPLNLFTRTDPSALAVRDYADGWSFSPTGDWAVVQAVYSQGCTVTRRANLVSLRGVARQREVFHQDMDGCSYGDCLNCSDLMEWSSAWDYDAGRAAVLVPRYDYTSGPYVVRTDMILTDTATQSTTYTREGWSVQIPRYTPDNLFWGAWESNDAQTGTTCNYVVRRRNVLSSILSTDGGLQSSCQQGGPPPVPYLNRIGGSAPRLVRQGTIGDRVGVRHWFRDGRH